MDGWAYTIRPWQGSLIRYKDSSDRRLFKTWGTIPAKVTENLLVCDQPFLAQLSAQSDWEASTDEISALQGYYSMMEKIGANRFAFLRIFSGFKVPLFETTAQALDAISCLPNEKQNYTKTCLIRSLIAAKVSKSFSQKGVIFIGASLPLGEMHAWVMEDQNNPDPLDRSWINYQPLLALY